MIAVWLPLGLVTLGACGPVAGDGMGSGDQAGSSADADATMSGASSVGTSADTTVDTATGSATAATMSTGSTGPSSTGPSDPIGTHCKPATPAVVPPVPQDCDPVWLVDPEGMPIEGAPSGLIRCPGSDPEQFDRDVYYRTAAVPCPELIGDECLCDSDCRQGQACICANDATHDPPIGTSMGNRCMFTNCASSDDCGGAVCRACTSFCYGVISPVFFTCARAEDACAFDSDCAASQLCTASQVGEPFSCVEGAICE